MSLNIYKNYDKIINDHTAQLADMVHQPALDTTNSDVALKANTADVNIQIAAIASGSPKGVYATLSALQTAYPTGNTNTYLVTADGNWYYWNGSAWTAGGTYQATGIAAGSIVETNFATAVINKLNTLYKTKVFKMNISGSVAPDANTLAYYNAIQSLQIYGSSKDYEHKIRYYVHNNGGAGTYQVVISRKISGVWSDYINTTLTSSIFTNNGSNLSIIQWGDKNKGFKMEILANEIQNSFILNDGGVTVEPAFYIDDRCVLENTQLGNPFNQSLNTTDNVTFNSVTVGGTIPTGTLVSPPAGLQIGDIWLDITDSTTYPKLRMRAV